MLAALANPQRLRIVAKLAETLTTSGPS